MFNREILASAIICKKKIFIFKFRTFNRSSLTGAIENEISKSRRFQLWKSSMLPVQFAFISLDSDVICKSKIGMPILFNASLFII